MEIEQPENAVIRPWGWYADGVTLRGIKTKILCVKPRQRLSLQSHSKRSEIWTVVRGEGSCIVEDAKIRVGHGSIVYIPIGDRHRVENLSRRDDLIISEVQMGTVCDEGDIVRYEDDYGRTETKGSIV